MCGRGETAHRGVHRRWWGSRAVGATGRARVILRATPAQTHTRVANGVSLHLVDGHFGGVALNELNETAALSRRNLDVGDLTKALEEGTELVLGDVARETTDENRCVVRIGELVHGLLRRTVEAHGRSTHRRVHARRARHTHGTQSDARTLVLRSGGGDAHGTVTAVDTLHFGQGALLIGLIREADEAVAARHSTDRVGHDLGGLAGREPALEEGDEDVFVDFRTQVTDEDGELRATVVTAEPMR